MKATKLVPMLGLVVIGLCSAFASRADAQCWGQVVQQQSARAFAQQASAERHTAQAVQPQEQAAQPQEEAVHPQGPAPTIVGLWDMQAIVDGQVVDEGFDQFHADGNEVLNDTPPPATGNVCLGVYVQTGKRTFKLRHPSWLYDTTNTTVIGRITILSDITLDQSGNSYTGTFTLQIRDLTGAPIAPDVSGQLKADRIVPQ